MNATQKTYLKELITIAVALLIAFLPPPAGLEQNAMIFMGILIWAILNWFLNTMPTYASGLIMLAMFALTGLTSFQSAFAPFATSVVWLILAVLLIGTAVSKSGLLSRVCLLIMKICSPTFHGQVLALLGGGCLLGPLMPSTSAKVAIAGPFATRIGELLGLEKRSKGMNGMFLAMETGFCLLAPMFITCSFWAYLVTGALTEEEGAMFTFLGWFQAMLPWSIVVLVGCYFAIVLMYRPEKKTALDRGDVEKMLADLGPLNRNEKITIVILVICLACWILERTINVSAVIPAVLAVGILTFLKVLTPKDLNSTNWGLILFVGESTGISSVVSAVGMDSWLAEKMGPVISAFSSSPFLFIFAVCIAVLLVRFFLVGGSSVIVLFMVLLTPVCQAAGINPWVVGTIAYVMNQPWFLRYENPPFNGGFEAAGGDDVLDFNGTIPYCAVFHIIALLGLFACVPFWKGMDILP